MASRIDPKKRARLVKLAKTGLYSKTDIKEDLIEKFGSSINEKTFDRILVEEKNNSSWYNGNRKR